MDGMICFRASQKSCVLLMVTVGGNLISMINSVNAMANTPSQNASSLELGLFSGHISRSIILLGNDHSIPNTQS